MRPRRHESDIHSSIVATITKCLMLASDIAAHPERVAYSAFVRTPAHSAVDRCTVKIHRKAENSGDGDHAAV